MWVQGIKLDCEAMWFGLTGARHLVFYHKGKEVANVTPHNITPKWELTKWGWHSLLTQLVDAGLPVEVWQ